MEGTTQFFDVLLELVGSEEREDDCEVGRLFILTIGEAGGGSFSTLLEQLLHDPEMLDRPDQGRHKQDDDSHDG